ncbi:MAG: proline dehydrogenase family protein [Phycisphaerae bacterium]
MMVPIAPNLRIREIGREIFERAAAARPRPWQKVWWLEAMMHTLDRDEKLRARAFQFVECLPVLRDPSHVRRHVCEYFDDETLQLPLGVRMALRPGPLASLRDDLLARAARQGAQLMAGRFIAGDDVPGVVRAIRRLRGDGLAFTLDVLGESTTSYARADAYARSYDDLIQALAPAAASWKPLALIDEDASGPMPRVNLSVKLTGLDPHFDAIDPVRALREAGGRLRLLLRRARAAGAFVNVDMESHRHRDLTLTLFKTLLMEEEFRDWSDVGIVVQAYLRDGQRDLDALLAWGRRRGTRFSVRLVKGAYWDSETAAAVRSYSTPPVWTGKWQSDACFERMATAMLTHADRIRPAFATHNVRSLAFVLAAAESLGVPPQQYELQMLFGMGDPLKYAVAGLGRCVRVYCPYGGFLTGMGYLIRRLLENTSNEGFLKQSHSDRSRHDRLLSDPALARPASAALPRRHYQNTHAEEPMSLFRNASHTDFTSAGNREKMIGALRYVRADAARVRPLLIDDQPIATDETFVSVNPSCRDEVIGRVAMAGVGHVSQAVEAARRAFGGWGSTRAADRAALMRRAADRIEMHRFELAATMILEVGKPWREADADVTEAVDHWRYYALQMEQIEARPRLRNLPGEDNMLTYAPKGVCAVLGPWCFPLAILSGMTGAALAAGNTVVIKPATHASLTAARLVDILREVGFPRGVVNFVPGQGAVLGPCLVRHPDVPIVAFTGSREAGAEVIATGAVVRNGQSFIRKMIVEMGGKNAIIVDDDADVDGAVQAIVESAFAFAGQKCSSCSRLIVLDAIHDALIDRLRQATLSLSIGLAEAPITTVGPVIDGDAKARITRAIQSAAGEAHLAVEAPLPAITERGHFVPPTIFTEVRPDAALAQDEILGPVLAVLRAEDFAHAVRLANQSCYALTGGVYSRSPGNIDLARRQLAVGNLYINRRITGSQVDAQPFGGFRLSGTGVKAGSPDYLLHFMDARCITENTTRSGFVPVQQRTSVS